MNILIITLGNSEIQFNKAYLNPFELVSEDKKTYLRLGDIAINTRINNRPGKEEWLIPISSRLAGKVISDYWNRFKSITRFPLIEPLLDFIRIKKVNRIILVATDQKDETHKKGDTIYYAQIIKKYLKQEAGLADITTLLVKSQLKDIDFQYKSIGKRIDKLLSDIDYKTKLFVFTQGGIDQINHALSLQLIQRYPHQVQLLQKAEDEPLKKLKFQHLFLHDLTKQKILKHLEDYDFRKAAILVFDDIETSLEIQYYADRLSLLHDKIAAVPFSSCWAQKSSIEQNRIKLKDLTYAFKIDYRNQNYNDALTKLFTIYENIFKIFIDEYTGVESFTFYNKKKIAHDTNDAWESFLKNKFGKDILEYLKGKREGIYLSNPNAMTYFYLIRYLVENSLIKQLSDNEIKKIDCILNDLRALRNEINHSLGSCREEEILNILKRHKIDLDTFWSLLDHFIGTSGMGEYELARDKFILRFKN